MARTPSQFFALGSLWTRLSGTARRFVSSAGETISRVQADVLREGISPQAKSKAIKAGTRPRRSSEVAAVGRATQARAIKANVPYVSATQARKRAAALRRDERQYARDLERQARESREGQRRAAREQERLQRKLDRDAVFNEARSQGVSISDANELARINQKLREEHLTTEEWKRYNKIDKRLKKKGIDAREIISPRRQRRPARMAA